MNASERLCHQERSRFAHRMMNTDAEAILAKLKELRVTFADVHRRGMACLESGDFDGFHETIEAEGRLIEAQAVLIHELRESTRQG